MYLNMCRAPFFQYQRSTVCCVPGILWLPRFDVFLLLPPFIVQLNVHLGGLDKNTHNQSTSWIFHITRLTEMHTKQYKRRRLRTHYLSRLTCCVTDIVRRTR